MLGPSAAYVRFHLRCTALSIPKFITRSNGYHLALDIPSSWSSTSIGGGAPIYAIGDGVVLEARSDIGSYKRIGSSFSAGGAMIVKHFCLDGSELIALYGHIQNFLPTGTTVVRGQQIAETGRWDGAHHLHFGIIPGSAAGSSWWRGYTTSTSNTYQFADPMPYLQSHPCFEAPSAYNNFPNMDD